MRRSNSSRALSSSCIAAANLASSSVDGCARGAPPKRFSSAADAACTSRAATAMRSSAMASSESVFRVVMSLSATRLPPQCPGRLDITVFNSFSARTQPGRYGALHSPPEISGGQHNPFAGVRKYLPFCDSHDAFSAICERPENACIAGSRLHPKVLFKRFT